MTGVQTRFDGHRRVTAWGDPVAVQGWAVRMARAPHVAAVTGPRPARGGITVATATLRSPLALPGRGVARRRVELSPRQVGGIVAGGGLAVSLAAAVWLILRALPGGGGVAVSLPLDGELLLGGGLVAVVAGLWWWASRRDGESVAAGRHCPGCPDHGGTT
jgi:hypothetical protein